MKNILIFGILMILVVFSLGCLGTTTTAVNETKLEANEGLGIVGKVNIETLNPGLEGYLSLTLRNNLGGTSASDVTVSLDNVYPFRLIECDYVTNNVSQIRSTLGLSCGGQDFDLDPSLPLRSHGVSKMFPGQELNFIWRLKAPDANEIANIALEHPIYYDTAYTYRTDFVQNILFMSIAERNRRQTAGEEYVLSGEANSGAGDILVSGTTLQPIMYSFSPGTKSPFNFALQYTIENKGKGIPLSDIILIFELPQDGNVDIDSAAKDYGWQVWTADSGSDTAGEWSGYTQVTSLSTQKPDGCIAPLSTSGVLTTWKCDCIKDSTPSGRINCVDWIKQSYGSLEYPTKIGNLISKDNPKLLVKIIPRTQFSNLMNVYIPLKLNENEVQGIASGNIPIVLEGFKMHTIYRYFIEGSSYITVYPIKI